MKNDASLRVKGFGDGLHTIMTAQKRCQDEHGPDAVEALSEVG